jgi:hypothetical protein
LPEDWAETGPEHSKAAAMTIADVRLLAAVAVQPMPYPSRQKSPDPEGPVTVSNTLTKRLFCRSTLTLPSREGWRTRPIQFPHIRLCLRLQNGYQRAMKSSIASPPEGHPFAP